MIERLAEALLTYTQRQPGEGPFITAIDGVAVMRSDHRKPPDPRLARPALCIVAQGAKWATFGGVRLEYRAGQALLIGVETPTTGQVIDASPGHPCLVLAVELDLDLMRSVAASLDAPPRPSGEPGSGVLVADFDGPLADCALRLVRLFDTPEAIPVLYPCVMREICYWLLTGRQAGAVARLALKTSPSEGIVQALGALRRRFRETVRVDDLADLAHLSASAFHRQFKALTSLTPVQYQKQLRLLEGRRLMSSLAYTAEAAAFAVGYESPSHFSREYARLFGAPPKRDLRALAARPGPEAASPGRDPRAQTAA